MKSSDKKSSSNPRRQSSTSKSRVEEASMDREVSCTECDPEELPRSFVDNDKPEFENEFPATVRRDRQPMEMDTEQELSAQPKASELTLEGKEQVRDWVQQRDKLSQLSESVHPRQPRATELTTIHEHTTACEGECNEALSREHELVRGKLQAKSRRLEQMTRIRSLEADMATLQRTSEEYSTALAFAHRQLRSCQDHLDNVQRFISTADAHADQDIIQKLQELNEEVYQISMKMADYVAEGSARQSTTARQMKENAYVGESVLATIGKVMVDHLAAVEGNEDTALFLQIAFQGYLSYLLCQIVSSWTIDPRLNALIEGTYQRLRKTEPQALCGRWRSLTRTHILPTTFDDPKVLVEYAMPGLSNIVMAAGLVSPQLDAASKLSSEFGEKIFSIVSHAGRFRDMVSGMISGEFEVFAVQPGAAFDGESMVDMNEDQVTPRGTGTAQKVLCVYRVGLRKQMGEKIMTVIKAQVVLKSFLG